MDVAALFESYRLQERHGPQIGMTGGYENGVWRYDLVGQDFRIVLDQNWPLAKIQHLMRSQQQLAQDSSITLEWKWFSEDSHASQIQEWLLEAGFIADEAEASMAVDIATIDWPEPNLKVTRCTRESQLETVFEIQQRVWQTSMSQRLEGALEIFRNQPERLSYYLVEIDGKAVCSGWASYTPNSDFVGLWGGSCLPQFRSLGCYRALVGARAQEAMARDRKYLSIDALPSSRPIVERLGFELLSVTVPYVFDGKG